MISAPDADRHSLQVARCGHRFAVARCLCNAAIASAKTWLNSANAGADEKTFANPICGAVSYAGGSAG